MANDIFIAALSQREVVCGIASEESDDFIEIKCTENAHLSKYVVLIDPLDGSSNIDVNVSVGTIFSIYLPALFYCLKDPDLLLHISFLLCCPNQIRNLTVDMSELLTVFFLILTLIPFQCF